MRYSSSPPLAVRTSEMYYAARACGSFHPMTWVRGVPFTSGSMLSSRTFLSEGTIVQLRSRAANKKMAVPGALFSKRGPTAGMTGSARLVSPASRTCSAAQPAPLDRKQRLVRLLQGEERHLAPQGDARSETEKFADIIPGGIGHARHGFLFPEQGILHRR